MEVLESQTKLTRLVLEQNRRNYLIFAVGLSIFALSGLISHALFVIGAAAMSIAYGASLIGPGAFVSTTFLGILLIGALPILTGVIAIKSFVQVQRHARAIEAIDRHELSSIQAEVSYVNRHMHCEIDGKRYQLRLPGMVPNGLYLVHYVPTTGTIVALSDIARAPSSAAAPVLSDTLAARDVSKTQRIHELAEQAAVRLHQSAPEPATIGAHNQVLREILKLSEDEMQTIRHGRLPATTAQKMRLRLLGDAAVFCVLALPLLFACVVVTLVGNTLFFGLLMAVMLVAAPIAVLYTLRAIKRGTVEMVSGPVTLHTMTESYGSPTYGGISSTKTYFLEIEGFEFLIDHSMYSVIYEMSSYRVYFVRNGSQRRNLGSLVAIECSLPRAGAAVSQQVRKSRNPGFAHTF